MRYQLRQGPDATRWPRVVALGLQDRVGGFLPQRLLVLAGVDALLGDDSDDGSGCDKQKLLHGLVS